MLFFVAKFHCSNIPRRIIFTDVDEHLTFVETPVDANSITQIQIENIVEFLLR